MHVRYNILINIPAYLCTDTCQKTLLLCEIALQALADLLAQEQPADQVHVQQIRQSRLVLCPHLARAVVPGENP